MGFEQLQLVCPACLQANREQLLERLHCPECRTDYPIVGDVPVLLADPGERAGLTGGSSDPRLQFFRDRHEFVRKEYHEQQMRELLVKRAPGLAIELGNADRGKVISAEMICVDLSLSRLAESSGATGICASAETIPLPRGSVSFLLTVATLEHVPDPAAAFCEIDRLLVPGGVAFVAPAWHCRWWAADGIPVRPYRDLSNTHKFVKFLLPVLDSILVRGISALPHRVLRRLSWVAFRKPVSLQFNRIRANYETYWMSDSDACSSIDSHEGILFFESRGYDFLWPKTSGLSRLLFRAGPIIVRKPSAATG